MNLIIFFSCQVCLLLLETKRFVLINQSLFSSFLYIQREAREVHKLDVELLSQRRAQERERQAKINQHLLDDITQNNIHTISQQPSISIGSISQRESFERQISDGKSSSSGSGSGSGTGGGLKITEKRKSTDGVSTSSTVIEVPSTYYQHPSPSSTTIDSECREGVMQVRTTHQ